LLNCIIVSDTMAEEEEEYDPAVDTDLSGVRFATLEDPESALDYNCERLYTVVQHFCGDRNILPPTPEDAEDELEPFFDSDDFPQPFIKLVTDNLADIFKPGADQKLIDFLFNVVFSVLFENKSVVQSNIEQMATILSSQSEEFNKTNLKLLCLLFNLVPADNALRFVVMQNVLNLGTKIKTILAQEMFTGRLECLEQWIESDWNSFLGLKDKKRLYQSASAVASKAAEKEMYLRYLIKYLQLFNFRDDDDDKADDESVVDEAAQAVIAVVSAESFNTKHVMELIRSHIIKNVMSETPKYQQLYKLLGIVYQGSVDDFEAFYAENKEYLSDSLGLNHANLLQKMRVLTLCSLANGEWAAADGDKKTNQYSFDDLIARLRLSNQDELEELIVGAMSDKVLFAKIDYAESEVEITKAKQRRFDDDFWGELANKLSLWRQNTNTVIQILHTAGLQKWRQQYMQEMARKSAKET